MQLRRQFAKGVDAGRGDTALKRAETRRSRGRSFVTRGLTAALLAVFAVLLALPVQAQTVTTLVSNTAQTAVGGSSNFLAQSFVTGTNATGYTVTEIDIRVSTASSRSTLLRVREDDGGEPGTLVATFMNPASPANQSLNTFTAPANTTLDASTTYWVSVNEGISSSRMSFSATSGNDETGEMGWSIGDGRLWRGSETDNWEASTVNLVIAIKGTTAAPGPTVVPNNWSLIPTGLSTGDKFRLIFLSSTKRDGSSTDIATYNTFVQTRAAAGHTDIQAYSDGFRVVGCTGSVDAVDNTGTTGVGVPIYWLNGNKVADDYADFYDGDWDDEANDKNELGGNGPNTNNSGNYPFTGCDHDGTEYISSFGSFPLGTSDPVVGRPNSSTTGYGPLASNNTAQGTSNRPMYGLSEVFEVGVSTVPAVLVSNTGQPPADFTTNAVDHGQAFTTGSDTAGYTLNAIDIGYNDSSNTAFSASIWSTYALDKAPNTVLYSLTPPATFSPGNLTFTAPPNTTLTTGTTYIIMLALADAGGATVKRTATVNPDEDAGAAAGWSIANNYIFAISGGWGQNGAFGPLLVAVKGTVYAGSNDATLSALTVNDGTNDLTLTPAFVSGTYAYEADVGNAVTTVTLSATVNDADAEITGVTLGGTAIADTDLTDGITVPSLAEGDNEIVVTVTAENASTQTYTVTVTVGETGICGRTAQVRDAILYIVGGNCADVTAADLASLEELDLSGESITALAAGDFAGMTELYLLDLGDNALSTLPDGLFADLTVLEELSLGDNDLTTLPTGVFDSLITLYSLDLAGNELSTLAADVFDDLTALETLDINHNDLTTLPAGVFDNPTALTTLDMNDNDLSTLSADVFEPLTALAVLDLAGNELSTLSVDLFDDLPMLNTLWLNGNDLTTLHADLFDGLTVMTDLDLSGNALATLPSAVFEDTTALILLKVADNLITTLPDDVFDGLTVLSDLDLSGNMLATLADNIFQPLTALFGESALDLSDNPGAPFGPTADALPDDAIIPTSGDTVTLDGSGSDGGPWGTNVTYLWALTIPDTGVTVTFGDDTSASTDVTIPALTEGTELTYTLTVSPRDGTAGIAPATDTAKVTATDVVPNATGKPGITGAAQVGMTLTAGTADIVDADGLTTPGYTYQWLQEGSDISGQTSSTYTPTSSDIGKNIKVKVDFTDDASNAESLTSDETTAVVPAAITCPTDTTWCSILTTGYQTPDSDNEFLLGLGTTVGTPSESFGSLATAAFTHLGLSYTVTQVLVTTDGGSALFATSPNLPNDGAGLTLSVQQVSGQRDIPLAGNAYLTVPYLPATTKTWQFVHALNSSVADPLTTPLLHGPDRNYDPYHHHTNKDTEVTIWLTFANRTAAGAPAIRGTAQVGETLTAGIGDIADVDGLPTTFPGDYTFQWLRVDADGVSNQTLIGTDATTYTPVAADTGKKIKVQVTFTDGGGTAETLTSVAYPSSGTVLAATRTVSISADKTSAVFREDSITYTLTRTGSTTAALPVSVTLTQTKNFLATTALSRTVTIAAGQSTKTFNVTGSSFQLFAAGTAVEGGTLTATVQDGTDYDLGTSSSVAVDIVIGATVRIELASYTVGEADGTLTVKQIARTGAGAPQPTSNTSSLFFGAVDGTALNAVDFDFSDLSTDFAPSEFSMTGGVWQAETSFDITITNDDLDEDDETFTLELYYQVGHQNTPVVDASGNACDSVNGCSVTITITDDDTAGVTVSKSAVTVTEQDTTGDTYTVVLDSQPTANVTITIGGQTAADITATPTPLTFTTTNWATAQTVTVTAGDDTDTAIDTHSLTHSATSTDTKYSGISIANVGVTVNDNDTANSAPTFSMSTESRTLAENTAAGQNVGGTFTATDADSDTITYTLEGTDTASFNLITASDVAQLRTKPGVTYNYEVKAAYTVTLKADDGNGGTDTVTVNITLTDVNEPPSTPAAPSVSGTAGSTTSLTVNWSAPTNTGPDINSYDLQYRQGTSGSFSNGPQNVNGLTTTIPNLSVNTSYQVQVRATNDEGNSPWSPSGTGSTDSLPVTPPGKVFGVNITASDQTLQVNWTQVSGATGYKVQWKSGGQSYGSSRQATISSGSTTSRTISSLNNGTEYTVRVIATKTGASDGIPSDDANGTPTAAITAPGAPRGLNATGVGNTRINLSWNAPASDGGSPITGYKIEVSSNGNSWTTRVANTGSANRTYSHTGLSTGDTRHYRVSAINSSGTGPHSNVARASTGLPVVSIAPASTTEGQDIVFTVTISPPISGFRRLSYGTGSDSIPSGSKAATAGTDYVTPHTASKVIQIGYGLTSVEIRFRTIDDDLVEGTEVFGIGLYGSGDEGRDYTVGTRTVIGTIRDNDNNGQRYVDTVRGNSSTSASISAGGSVTGRIEEVSDADWYRTSLTAGHCYRIGVAGSSDSDSLTLPYPALYGVHKSDSTRISGTSARADYAGNKAISHVKLDTTGTYYISVGVHRFLGEGTYRLSLRDLGTSDTSCGAAKLAGPVQISVADVSREESESTRTYLIFEVTLNRAADKEVRVSYATVDGTARAGRDYESQSGTLVFERRDRTKQIWVPVEFDDEDEETETLTLRLSNAVGGEIRRGVATGSIYDYSTSR